MAAILLIASFGAWAAAGAISPRDVLIRIERHGAAKVSSELFNPNDWPQVLAGIASGDNDWLRVYAAIRPVADGELGEDLGESIFSALPRNPFKVIPIVSSEHDGAADVCTFDPDAELPAGGMKTYLDALDKALDRARGDAQLRMARLCRAGIRNTRMKFGREPRH